MPDYSNAIPAHLLERAAERRKRMGLDTSEHDALLASLEQAVKEMESAAIGTDRHGDHRIPPYGPETAEPVEALGALSSGESAEALVKAIGEEGALKALCLILAIAADPDAGAGQHVYSAEIFHQWLMKA